MSYDPVSSNTGGAGVIYAPQKIGLLPDWAQDGARDPKPKKDRT